MVLQTQLEEKNKEMSKLKKEIEERISQSSQVASMKKIIQQKNEQITELKERYNSLTHLRRLRKHEKVD